MLDLKIQKSLGDSIKLLTIIIMQSNIEMFKRLQERITALEMRVEAIEGEKPSEVKVVTFEQYQKYSSNSEELFLLEATHLPFPQVLNIR